MDGGGLDRGICRLPTIHTLCHIHWMCCYSGMIPSGHMTSIVHLVTWHLFFCPPWRGILLCCSPEGFFPFFPVFWEFFQIRCEVKGLRSGMSMRTDSQALWGKFVICENGLYEINWIEKKRDSTRTKCLWGAAEGLAVTSLRSLHALFQEAFSSLSVIVHFLV